MEFYQFHPTALAIEGAPRFLVSEALRGEGAYLRNDRGERFMERYHPQLELAPRDVVARAIARESLTEADARTGEAPALRPVYLDMRHVRNIDLIARFPGISAFLARYSLDLRRDLIPVRPAAHYLMGGVRTDLDGRTNLEHLYAAGEAACTGVHGANRLASNSLLEGVVFGMRAGRAMRESVPGSAPADGPQEAKRPKMPEETLRSLTWRNCGIVRTGAGLSEALNQLNREIWMEPCATVADYELRNMHAVAQLIAASALGRCESRGGHYRSDYPSKSEAFQKHSVVSKAG